jgi:hypothetical protein
MCRLKSYPVTLANGIAALADAAAVAVVGVVAAPLVAECDGVPKDRREEFARGAKAMTSSSPGRRRNSIKYQIHIIGEAITRLK